MENGKVLAGNKELQSSGEHPGLRSPKRLFFPLHLLKCTLYKVGLGLGRNENIFFRAIKTDFQEIFKMSMQDTETIYFPHWCIVLIRLRAGARDSSFRLPLSPAILLSEHGPHVI